MASHQRLTRGAVRFAAWLNAQPSQTAGAEMLGIRQQHANRIALGRRVPRTFKLIERIREVVGIDPGDWSEFTRRPVPPVRPRIAPKAA